MADIKELKEKKLIVKNSIEKTIANLNKELKFKSFYQKVLGDGKEEKGTGASIVHNLTQKKINPSVVMTCPCYFLKKDSLYAYFELSEEVSNFIKETPLKYFARDYYLTFKK